VSTGWLSDRQRHGGIDEIPLPDHVSGRLWLCGKRAIADGRFADDETPWSTVVCLCQRHELADRYPDYVAWMEEPGHHSIWWPIPDLGAAPLAATIEFVDDLASRLRAGERLLVHCAAGIGRAGTTAVCVLIRLGVDVDAARQVVAEARLGAGPEAGVQLALVHAMSTEP
jgi:protein-tyrosine phosphatase